MKPLYEVCDRCKCEKPQSDLICRICLGVCKIQLGKLLTLYRFAGNAATLLPGNGGSGSRSSERTIGLKTPSLSFSEGRDLVRMLSAWKEWVWDTYDFENDFGPYQKPVASSTYSVPNLIEFLLVHFDKMAVSQEMAPFLIAEIDESYTEGLKEVGLTPPKQNRVKCPSDWQETKKCNMTLIVDMSDLKSTVQCRRCKRVWQVAQLMYVAATTPGIPFWASAFDIAHLKGLTVRATRYRIKKWDIPKVPIGAYYDFGKFSAKFEEEQNQSNETRK